MLQVVMTERTRNEFEWQIFAGSSDAPAGQRPTFVRHAHGEIRISGTKPSAGIMVTALSALRERCTSETSAEDHYRRLSAFALDYGPSFRGVEAVWTGDREAIARLKPAPSGARGLHLHPGLLDSALQLLVTGLSTTRTAFVLVSAGQVRLLAPCPRSGNLWAHASWRHEGIDARGTVHLLTETGELVAQISDVGLRSLELSTVDTSDAAAAEALIEEPLIATVTAEASDDPVAVLAGRLREYVAGVLRLAPARVDLDQSLTTMGIDSLMAIELKSRIERELGVAIPLLQIARGPSLTELARFMVGSTVAEAPLPVSPRSDSLLSSLMSLKGKGVEQ
jgi:acyl carrier protein